MRIKYKVSLVILAILILGLVGIEINYQAYQKNNDDLSAFIKVEEGLSINYLNGKSIEVKKGEKSVSFSVTNQLDEVLYYNIEIAKISKDISNVSYRLSSDNPKVSEAIGNLEQKSLVSRIAINPLETHRYTLEVINSNMDDFNFELDVAVEEVDNSFANNILNNNVIKESAATAFNVSATTKEGLIKQSAEHGDIYYFRGSVDNNYVSFANNIWRIVKINEDKTVKLVLDKTTENLAQMNTTEMVGNIDFLSSNIFFFLNNWYDLYLKEYDDYIAGTYYCFDNSVTTNSLGNIDYLANTRLFIDYMPTNTCSGINISSKIALLTADEVVMAGASVAENKNYYLYLNDLQASWWTMTPNKKENDAISYIVVNKDGALVKDVLEDSTAFIRPTITIGRKVKSTGTGVVADPYVLNWS